MIPVAVLIPILGSAVKLLAGGPGPSQSEWNGVVTGVLTALLAERDETNASLSRIEAKLDALALQDFEHSFGAALNQLEEATPAYRDPAERERMLATARDQLGRALVAVDDPLGKAMASWYLGIAWLLSRSRPDCDSALQRAARCSFEALLQATNDWSPSPLDPRLAAEVRKLESGFDRLAGQLVGYRSEQVETTARQRLRSALIPRLREAEATFRAIRETRLALGATAAESPALRLWPTLDRSAIWNQELHWVARPERLRLVVDLGEGTVARLGDFEVGVLSLRIPPGPRAAGEAALVDAELALASRSDGEQRFHLIGLNEERVERRQEFAAARPVGCIRDDASLLEARPGSWARTPAGGDAAPPLSGKPLMADGSYHPQRGTIRLKPGQSTRGWVRFGVAGEAVGVGLIPAGTERHVQFIRQL